MKIVALDLGQDKSVACVFDSQTGEAWYETIQTRPQAVHDLLLEQGPQRLVIEIGPSAGWVHDLGRALDIEVEVANPNHEGWRWRNTRHKCDRTDALKLARLSVMGQLPRVHMPSPQRRGYRHLIRFRQAQVSRVTAIKNSIRAILTREGIRHPSGKSGWTRTGVAALQALASVGDGALWRDMLAIELEQLSAAEGALSKVEAQLDALAEAEPGVQLLQTIPGVGPRLAEVIVAVIDDPGRFKNKRQVGSYAGLTPRRYQSGSMDRQGRISGQGDRLLRSLLVEVSWIGRRWNGWLREVYERVRRGSAARKKIAIVAVARRLLVVCWAMLRDGTAWRQPPGEACA